MTTAILPVISFYTCIIFAHAQQFKTDKISVSWTIEQPDAIVFDVQARTLGWVGIGFSLMPSMDGADVVVGGVKNGQPYLYDRHATEKDFPLDKEQNYELISGIENSTHTMLKFRRKVDTGDKNDFKFNDKPFYILWALNPNDAVDIANIPTTNSTHGASQKPMTVHIFHYHINLDHGGLYQLFWKFDNDTITFQYHATTRGWASLGFSPNGGMAGADMVVIWMDQSGQAQISDRHSSHNGYPPEDAHQDYMLLDCVMNETHLIATFWRKRITCDSQDWPLHASDTTRVIYASHDSLPRSKDDFKKHSVRGTKSVHLIGKPLEGEDGVPPEPGAKPILLNVTNAQVSGDKDTTWWCEIVKVPKASKRVHIIKTEAVIEPQNSDIVHHIFVYVCSKDVSQYVGKRVSCFDMEFNHCKMQALAGWAVGSSSITSAPDKGLPFYVDEGDIYILMEIHYDNPQLKKGRVDSSGLRLWTTERLRPIETGCMSMGILMNADQQVIPPGVDEFTNYAICNAPCTDTGFSKEGVKVISFFLHAHLAARKIRIRHFRNGKQLPNIAADEHFDFNYQSFRKLSEPITVLPGDDLVLECVYDTVNRNTTTFGGHETRDEMCVAYMEYYPTTYRGFLCVSVTNKRQLFTKYGINFAPPLNAMLVDEYVTMPDGEYKPLRKYLLEDHKFNWTQETIKEFQQETRTVNYTVICARISKNQTIDENNTATQMDLYQQNGYPLVKEPFIVQDICDKAGKGNQNPVGRPSKAGTKEFSSVLCATISAAMIFVLKY